MAVIGALAYQAMKRYQAKQGGEAAATDDVVPPQASGFHPEDQEGGPQALEGERLDLPSWMTLLRRRGGAARVVSRRKRRAAGSRRP